jgi:hypothetical protein
VVASPTYVEYLPVPAGTTIGMVIGSGGCNMKQMRSIARCGVIVEKDKVSIGTDSRENQKLLVDKMKLILSQERVSGPSWTYIHPQGVSSLGTYEFIPYHGRIPVRALRPGLTMYELYGDLPQGGTDEDDIVRGVAAMSPFTADDKREGLQSKLRQLHGETQGEAERLTWKQKTRIHLEPKGNIKQSLTDGLRLLCDKKEQERFITRLDARFGKVTWSKFPEEVYRRRMSIQELGDLLFVEQSKHINIFNTDIQALGAEAIRKKCRRSPSYPLETFDVKLTSIGSVGGGEGETRLDIRLLVRKSDDGRTGVEVALVKKNEIKDVTFDILNIHRKHDVRIGLHHYKCVEEGEPIFGIVREMVGRMAFPSRHRVRFQPRSSRWSVHLIRHKQKTTYIMDGGGFAVTVATVSEHSFDAKNDEAVEFDMRMEAKETHAEVELHNLAWEYAFGRDAGLSADKSLALHMERGSADTGQFDTIPYPWQTASILRDFDAFWSHLETLTDRLDGPQ